MPSLPRPGRLTSVHPFHVLVAGLVIAMIPVAALAAGHVARAGTGVAGSQSGVVACRNHHDVLVAPRSGGSCPKGSSKVKLGATGPRGPRGPAGPGGFIYSTGQVVATDGTSPPTATVMGSVGTFTFEYTCFHNTSSDVTSVDFGYQSGGSVVVSRSYDAVGQQNGGAQVAFKGDNIAQPANTYDSLDNAAFAPGNTYSADLSGMLWTGLRSSTAGVQFTAKMLVDATSRICTVVVSAVPS